MRIKTKMSDIKYGTCSEYVAIDFKKLMKIDI